MKSNTNVFVAIRNIGDANDNGEVFEGPLRDAMFWLVSRVGAITMAKRIAIGIGRDKSGALAAVETKRNQTGLVIELEDELNRLMADTLEDDDSYVASDNPADTWKGVSQ